MTIPAPPSVPTVTAAPSRGSPGPTFAAVADAFAASLVPIPAAINAVSAWTEARAAEIEVGAAAAEAAIAAANFQGTWDSGTTYDVGVSVLYSDVIYLSLQGSNLNNQPDVSAAFWRPIRISSIDYQEFTSSGTWTKPNNALYVIREVIAPGGSGGSGIRSASGNRFGGGGGGGGARDVGIEGASAYSANEDVVVGAVGAPGAAITTDSTIGQSAASSGDSSFAFHVAAAGFPGSGGGTANGLAGNGGGINGASAATAGLSFGVGALGSSGAGRSSEQGASGSPAIQNIVSGAGNSLFAGAGGGAGGCISSTGVVTRGSGAGTRPGPYVLYSSGQENPDGAAGGETGIAGEDGAAAGHGGGGGGLAANGGNGNLGGGGGGGGATSNGTNSGAGGSGGAGRVRIWTICQS